MPPSDNTALMRVQHYVNMRNAMPLKGIGDSVHTIHQGTKWEAELTLSDLVAVMEEFRQMAEERLQLSKALHVASEIILRGNKL